jgi:hypothetical protein
MTPSVGIIIYQSPLKIHRPVWCWLGWGVEGWRRKSLCASIAALSKTSLNALTQVLFPCLTFGFRVATWLRPRLWC